MVYENKIPQTETIYELKENYEIKTSQLSPAAQSKIIRKWGGNYLSEQAFSVDLSWPKGYGPTTTKTFEPHIEYPDYLNNDQSACKEFFRGIGEVAKFGAKLGGSIAIGAVVAATGPFSIPLGAAVAAEGYFIKKASEQSDSEFVRGVGGFVGDTVMGGGVGGIANGVIGTASSSLTSKGANLALNSALSNGSEELLRVWIYTKAAQTGYSLGGNIKNALEGFCSFYHGTHKERGVEYEKECPICNGNFDKYFWL